MEEYTKEELETDIEWFAGLGLCESDAKDYIFFLLNRKPSKEIESLN